MPKPEAWVPLRWQCGPLDTAVLKTPSADTAKVHQAWNDPGRLTLLNGTPINCLVVTWAAGRPEDAAQQESLAPLIAAGRARGIAVVGRIVGDAPAAFATAKTGGLDAVIADQVPPNPELPVIGATKIDDFNVRGNTHLVGLSDLPWPQIPHKPKGGSGGENAGPTGNPWIDSNGWAIQLSRTLAPDHTPWVMAEPPAEEQVFTAESYLVAVCDAAALGARWPIALDHDLRGQMAAGDPRALQIWGRITSTQAYFESRRTTLLGQRLVARLGVCSDFTGGNAYLATEFLNLASRRWLPYRILRPRRP